VSISVLFATSEAFPFVKTGGLADVSGALPRALKSLGVDVRIILPRYGNLKRAGDYQYTSLGSIEIVGQQVEILQTTLPGSDVTVYLVDHPMFSARHGNPYMGPDGNPWHDNPDRFALFCRAAVAVAADELGTGWSPDIIHANDWQTGLIPALLSEADRPRTLFTLHNLAYQGVFDRSTFERLGLPWSLWNENALEYWGNMSFIKGGIVFAEYVTTVSPTYAREIQTPEFGYGLDGLLRHRSERIVGILNGIGADWNPANDEWLAQTYDSSDLSGKMANKRALQQEMGLPVDPDIPLITHVGRLVEQKGIDLMVRVLDALGERRVQFALLGSGEARFEQSLRALAARYPDRVAVRIGYDEGLAHRLEAGGDAFLMPSRFEPCGLNQLYSLRYGTLPIVHRVGGLADTVVHADNEAIAEGLASGIVMDHLDVPAILWGIDRLLELYADRETFRAIQKNAMHQRFDWDASAQKYEELYQRALMD